MTKHLRVNEAGLGFTRNRRGAADIKAWLLASAIALPFLATVAPSLADDRSQVCSNASLKGRYGMATHGEVLGVKDASGIIRRYTTPISVEGIGVETFDGSRGKATYAHLLFANGRRLCHDQCGEFFSAAVEADYQVNSDCTGVADGKYSESYNIERALVLSNQGKTVRMLWTSVRFPLARALLPDGVTACPANGCDLAVQLSSVGERFVSDPDWQQTPEPDSIFVGNPELRR
jgi:hypothetical protein